MFSDLQNLRDQIRSYNLDRLEDQLVQLARPSIRMTCTAARDEDLPYGASKLGGLPDVPAHFEWPHWGAKPLTFVGQFELSELTPYDPSNLLPNTGRLYFFYEADEAPLNEPPDRDGWSLIYVQDENVPLVRVPHPTFQGRWGKIEALPAHEIVFSTAVSLSTIFYFDRADFGIEFENLPEPAHSFENGKFDDIPSEFNAYWKMVALFDHRPRHFWFGHPCRYQDHVEREAAIQNEQITMQEDFESGKFRYIEEQLLHIQSKMMKWQFLFQIDSDDSLGVIWGETGTLYVCIPKASLAERRFEDCWTIMQCT